MKRKNTSYDILEDIIQSVQMKKISTEEAFTKIINLMNDAGFNGKFYLDEFSYIHYQSYNNPNPYLPSMSTSIIHIQNEQRNYYNPLLDVLEQLDEEERAMNWITNRINEVLDIDERRLFFYLFVRKLKVRKVCEMLFIATRKYYSILSRVNKKAREALILIPFD